jgi:hypothetical protein
VQSIKGRWQSATVLSLAAAIAVPAWANSGGGGDVERTSKPSGLREAVQLAPASARPGDAVRALPPIPIRRKELDRSLQCMSDHGFGQGSATDHGGTFIPRSETKTREFRRAAKECKLPPPPTNAQIRQIGCRGARAGTAATPRRLHREP